MKLYIRNNLRALDRLLNSLLGGDPEEYLSSRLGKGQRGDFGFKVKVLTWPFRILVDAIFWPIDGWGHCRQYIDDTQGDDELVFRKGTNVQQT